MIHRPRGGRHFTTDTRYQLCGPLDLRGTHTTELDAVTCESCLKLIAASIFLGGAGNGISLRANE